MSTLKEKALQIQQEKNTKIIPENFSENLEIFGIQGQIDETDGWSSDTNIIYNYSDENRLVFRTDLDSRKIFNSNSNIQIGALYNDIVNTINLTADKIKKDETILGVTGTLNEGTATFTSVEEMENSGLALNKQALVYNNTEKIATLYKYQNYVNFMLPKIYSTYWNGSASGPSWVDLVYDENAYVIPTSSKYDLVRITKAAAVAEGWGDPTQSTWKRGCYGMILPHNGKLYSYSLVYTSSEGVVLYDYPRLIVNKSTYKYWLGCGINKTATNVHIEVMELDPINGSYTRLPDLAYTERGEQSSTAYQYRWDMGDDLIYIPYKLASAYERFEPTYTAEYNKISSFSYNNGESNTTNVTGFLKISAN